MSSTALQYVGGALIAALAVWGLVAAALFIRSWIALTPTQRAAVGGIVSGEDIGPARVGRIPSKSELAHVQKEYEERERRRMRLHLAEHFIAYDGQADKPLHSRIARVTAALDLADELLLQNATRPIKEHSHADE